MMIVLIALSPIKVQWCSSAAQSSLASIQMLCVVRLQEAVQAFKRTSQAFASHEHGHHRLIQSPLAMVLKGHKPLDNVKSHSSRLLCQSISKSPLHHDFHLIQSWLADCPEQHRAPDR